MYVCVRSLFSSCPFTPSRVVACWPFVCALVVCFGGFPRITLITQQKREGRGECRLLKRTKGRPEYYKEVGKRRREEGWWDATLPRRIHRQTYVEYCLAIVAALTYIYSPPVCVCETRVALRLFFSPLNSAPAPPPLLCVLIFSYFVFF